MTTERVYRGRLAHEAAIRELERCAGAQFDPAVPAAFKAELAGSHGERSRQSPSFDRRATPGGRRRAATAGCSRAFAVGAAHAS